METIYIKRQYKSNDSKEYTYIVPAVGIRTREGMRLIPHPYGTEVTAFEDLELAISTIHRAGHAAEFEGKHYPLPNRQGMNRSRPSLRSGSSAQMRMVENAIPFLQDQLNDSVPSVVASAAFALGELRDEGALPGLIHCLSNEDAAVRKNVAEALAKIGKPALHAVQHALKDKHWLVRHTALATILELVYIGPDLVPDLLPDALPLLKDDSWLVRSQAATVFGEAAKVFQEKHDKESGSGKRET
jgi:hypothetical protein